MRVQVELIGDVLTITWSDVENGDTNRLTRIELDLLRTYLYHRSGPWIINARTGKARVTWVKRSSDIHTYNLAKQVLSNYCFTFGE